MVIGVVAYGAATPAPPRRAGRRRHVLGWLGIVNAVLGVFNLLPGAPLDGGRIVRAVRWARHGNRYRAMREAGQAGRVIGWGLAAVGLALMLNDRPGLWLLVTGLFIALNARAEIAFADVSERLDGVTVGDLTWFGVAETGTDMDADSMIWQRSRLGGAGAVAVRGDDGELDGLVLEDQLWAVPAEQRPWVMLTSLMAPFSRLAKADPDDELASVLPRLNPLRPIVTVWRDGRLLGVVPPNALRQKLSLASVRSAPPTGRRRSGVADGPGPLGDGVLVAPREVDPQVGALPHVVAPHDGVRLLVQHGVRTSATLPSQNCCTLRSVCPVSATSSAIRMRASWRSTKSGAGGRIRGTSRRSSTPV